MYTWCNSTARKFLAFMSLSYLGDGREWTRGKAEHAAQAEETTACPSGMGRMTPRGSPLVEDLLGRHHQNSLCHRPLLRQGRTQKRHQANSMNILHTPKSNLCSEGGEMTDKSFRLIPMTQILTKEDPLRRDRAGRASALCHQKKPPEGQN